MEAEEECELQQLVPSEEEHNLGERCEITPPATPTVSRLAHKSPVSPNAKVLNRQRILYIDSHTYYKNWMICQV